MRNVIKHRNAPASASKSQQKTRRGAKKLCEGDRKVVGRRRSPDKNKTNSNVPTWEQHDAISARVRIAFDALRAVDEDNDRPASQKLEARIEILRVMALALEAAVVKIAGFEKLGRIQNDPNGSARERVTIRLSSSRPVPAGRRRAIRPGSFSVR